MWEHFNVRYIQNQNIPLHMKLYKWSSLLSQLPELCHFFGESNLLQMQVQIEKKPTMYGIAFQTDTIMNQINWVFYTNEIMYQIISSSKSSLYQPPTWLLYANCIGTRLCIDVATSCGCERDCCCWWGRIRGVLLEGAIITWISDCCCCCWCSCICCDCTWNQRERKMLQT